MAELQYASNKSFVLHGIDHTVFEEKAVREPGPHEVVVQVKKTGICGSDVHYLAHGRIGDFLVESPMVLGHESAGIIFKVGSKVTNLKPGDRVALEPGQACRTCDSCKRGVYQQCADMVFAATPPYDGTLGRYYTLSSDIAYLLPDNLDLEDGALMEPLSVATHALDSIAQLKVNDTIAIFGAGPVGLLLMAVAKAFGAKRIIAVDINQARLDFAKSYAATDIYLSPSKLSPQESNIDYSKRVADEMKAKFGLQERGANSVDVVVDASGAETCIQIGLYLAKHGGTFVQVGMGSANVTIPITYVLVKELKVLGSFRYGPGNYPLSIDLVAQGKVNLKPLITHRFAFDDALVAFKTTRAGKSEDGVAVIKAIINGPE